MTDELKKRRIQKKIDNLNPFIKSACDAFGIELSDFVQWKSKDKAVKKEELFKILKQKHFTNKDE